MVLIVGTRSTLLLIVHLGLRLISGFIKGRQILDSILVANEAVEEVKRKKSKCIMFKVDFEKAYDSVSWFCLQFVMCKMGFPTIWCTWIAECLKTSRMSVLVNGSPTEEFGVSKGLRQGDPLAPFLFLIVAEGLFMLFNRASQLERFKGCLVGKDKVPFDILQYADDTLIMGHASEWLQIMASILHCRVGSTPFSYLGLPIGENHRMISTWHPVIEKVKKRLSRWKCIISSIESLFKSFLWGADHDNRKINWAAWDVVCRDKIHGGLGIKDLSAFNLALLGK
uniref:Reverse transcriptase domain-containing protein n=1 Tax=Cajanus cajan TaxID=3821 RepID=A0A151RNQ7_CAJCA|nr:hypothetical protein KK1_034378 [Cajanus cajan]